MYSFWLSDRDLSLVGRLPYKHAAPFPCEYNFSFSWSYLVSVGVAPLPQLLEQPKNVRVEQGDSVQLSCKVSGFANVTVVQWMKNHIDLKSDTSEYTTRRENVTDDEFVETLQFVASSTAFGGNYSCCLGVRNASSDRKVSTTITRPTTRPGEFDCGAIYGVVSVTSKYEWQDGHLYSHVKGQYV